MEEEEIDDEKNFNIYRKAILFSFNRFGTVVQFYFFKQSLL